MKRIIILLIMSFCLLSCAKQGEIVEESKTTTTELTTTKTTPSTIGEGMVSRSNKEILDMIEDDETFILILGKTTCPACMEYKPHVEELLKEYPWVSVYYANLDEGNSIVSDKIMELTYIEYTPTTFLIIDGEILDAYVGTNDETLIKMINSIKW